MTSTSAVEDPTGGPSSPSGVNVFHLGAYAVIVRGTRRGRVHLAVRALEVLRPVDHPLSYEFVAEVSHERGADPAVTGDLTITPLLPFRVEEERQHGPSLVRVGAAQPLLRVGAHR